MAEYLLVGLFGALSQLLVFALNLNGRISNSSVLYVGTNAFGAMFTSFYAIVNNDVPFLVLEATWGFFAFIKLWEIIGKRRGSDGKRQ